MTITSKLTTLNDTNGDQVVLRHIHQEVLKTFASEEIIYGAEFGIAYGGGLEQACKAFKGKGVVYGFDTFAGHPKHLSADPNSAEALCMDGWYKTMGMDSLTEEYISKVLSEEGLDNYRLVKGEVSEESAKDIPKLHYVLIDLDIIGPMKIAWKAVEDKLVSGAYVCIHDIFPESHLGGHINHWWYQEVMPTGRLKEVSRGTGKDVWVALSGEEQLRGRFIGVYQVL